MKSRRKKWKIYWIGTGAVCLLVLGRCHLIAPALRRPDAVLAMKTTGYCACRTCCSWKLSWFGLPVYTSGSLKGKFKIIGQTASGAMARPGTVAVDPGLFPMGTRFYIPGYGRAVARDTGGDINGRHLDLFFWRHQTGENWGVQTRRVKVWFPRN